MHAFIHAKKKTGHWPSSYTMTKFGQTVRQRATILKRGLGRVSDAGQPRTAGNGPINKG
jgi:hypothetical protein